MRGGSPGWPGEGGGALGWERENLVKIQLVKFSLAESFLLSLSRVISPPLLSSEQEATSTELTNPSPSLILPPCALELDSQQVPNLDLLLRVLNERTHHTAACSSISSLPKPVERTKRERTPISGSPPRALRPAWACEPPRARETGRSRRPRKRAAFGRYPTSRACRLSCSVRRLRTAGIETRQSACGGRGRERELSACSRW